MYNINSDGDSCMHADKVLLAIVLCCLLTYVTYTPLSRGRYLLSRHALLSNHNVLPLHRSIFNSSYEYSYVFNKFYDIQDHPRW